MKISKYFSIVLLTTLEISTLFEGLHYNKKKSFSSRHNSLHCFLLGTAFTSQGLKYSHSMVVCPSLQPPFLGIIYWVLVGLSGFLSCDSIIVFCPVPSLTCETAPVFIMFKYQKEKHLADLSFLLRIQSGCLWDCLNPDLLDIGQRSYSYSYLILFRVEELSWALCLTGATRPKVEHRSLLGLDPQYFLGDHHHPLSHLKAEGSEWGPPWKRRGVLGFVLEIVPGSPPCFLSILIEDRARPCPDRRP